MDTKIHNRIWSDPDFIELNDSEKLCYLWAITNTNTCGYLQVSEKKLARDIDADYRDLETALQKVFKEDAVFSDNGVWFRCYIREQLGSDVEKFVSNTIFTTVKKHAVTLCPDDVRELIYTEYPEIRDREPVRRRKGASKGHTKGEGEGKGDGDGYGEVKGEVDGGGEIKGERSGAGDDISNKEQGQEMLNEMIGTVAKANENRGAPTATCYTWDE